VALYTCSSSAIPALHRVPVNWEPKAEDYACLEVSDSGSGIAEEDLEKLFDPFFSTRFTGRGMGLPVVLGFVQAHGGSISVESRPGHGCVFRVYFPVSSENPLQSMKTGPSSLASHASGTVLLVDDEPMLLDSARGLLEVMGFRVLVARDGMEALEVFRDYRKEIRCVITDLTMPRLDGWGTLLALRELDPVLPVILVSGYARVQVMAGEHAQQPQAFLSKPFSFKQLQEAVALALGTSR
jgi:CheY-like chemotaxis protein